MRCDDCGSDIPEGQEIETTRSEQTGSAGLLGARTSTETVTICPSCARGRNFWGWMAGATVAVLIIGGVAAILSDWDWIVSLMVVLFIIGGGTVLIRQLTSAR